MGMATDFLPGAGGRGNMPRFSRTGRGLAEVQGGAADAGKVGMDALNEALQAALGWGGWIPDAAPPVPPQVAPQAPPVQPGLEEALVQPPVAAATPPPTPAAPPAWTPPDWGLPPDWGVAPGPDIQAAGATIPYHIRGPGVAGPMEQPEQSEESMEALKARLNFEWADKASIDTDTGRPAQPREVFLADTGAPLAASRRPGTGYTPPKESRGGNLSDMRSRLERMPPSERAALSPDERMDLEGDMTPTQERADFEDLQLAAEAKRLGIMARDPWAAERATAAFDAEGKVRVKRGEAEARADVEQEAREDFMGQFIAAQRFLDEELDDMEAQAAAEGWDETERAKVERQIRDETKNYLYALEQSVGVAKRTLRDDIF